MVKSVARIQNKAQLTGLRSTRSARRLTLSLGLLLLVQTLQAHDFWIEPSNFRPDPGAVVRFTARVGDHFQGEIYPRNPRHLKRFIRIDPRGQEESIPGTRGQSVLGEVVADSGTHIIFYTSTPSISRLEAAKFRSYLEEESQSQLADRIDSENGDVVETFTRYAKTLVIGGNQAGRDRLLNLPLEILLETPLDQLQSGVKLRIKLLQNGVAVPDHPLKLYRQTASETQTPLQLMTDSAGSADVTLPAAGIWMARSVKIQPPENDSPRRLWSSDWASLTFHVQEIP